MPSKSSTKPDPKKRVDTLLVERGLADTIELARALVMAGQVVMIAQGEERVDKPSHLISVDVGLRVKNQSRFVSRGGDKLWGAIEDLGLKDLFQDAVVLDIGASTGGFTHCCLELGAKQVIALDVGSNQLAWELRNDARVLVMEKTDLRAFDPKLAPAIDIVIGDVSFNSWQRLAPYVRQATTKATTSLLVLVKPQFELARDLIETGGIVTDNALRTHAVEQVKEAFSAAGFTTLQTIDARVAGRSGNREIFLYASLERK